MNRAEDGPKLIGGAAREPSGQYPVGVEVLPGQAIEFRRIEQAATGSLHWGRWVYDDEVEFFPCPIKIAPAVINDDVTLGVAQDSRCVGVIEPEGLCNTRHQLDGGRWQAPAQGGAVGGAHAETDDQRRSRLA